MTSRARTTSTSTGCPDMMISVMASLASLMESYMGYRSSLDVVEGSEQAREPGIAASGG